MVIARHSAERAEAASRQSLRAQIGRLERDLAQILAETYPRVHVHGATHHDGPRLLTVGELEETRDALAGRVLEARRRAGAQSDAQAVAKARLDAMLADPAAYRGARVTNAELGLPGCTTYEVRPRIGLIGAFAKWWRVKVSSGCP